MEPSPSFAEFLFLLLFILHRKDLISMAGGGCGWRYSFRPRSRADPRGSCQAALSYLMLRFWGASSLVVGERSHVVRQPESTAQACVSPWEAVLSRAGIQSIPSI